MGLGLGLGHLIQGGRHSVELEEAVVDPVASDAAYSQARVEGVAGDGRHVDALHELEDGLRREHLRGVQAGNGARGTQAGHGTQGMQAGDGARGTQAGDGVQGTQAGMVRGGRRQPWCAESGHARGGQCGRGGRRAIDGLVAGGVAVACGGFDQLMTPPAAPVVTTSVPACVRAMHEAW